MKMRWLADKNSKKETGRMRRYGEFVTDVEPGKGGDKVRLRVTMSEEFYNELYEFLRGEGLTCWGNDKRAIPMLIEYGISEDNREELIKNKSRVDGVMSHYAAMRFQTSEYYAQNNAIVCGLRLLLQENRALKRELRERGLGDYVSDDEWDRWDDDFINEFYRLYLFCK